MAAHSDRPLLLADDDPAFVRDMTDYFRQHGLALVAVGDPAAVLPELRRLRPALLVLDQFLARQDMLARLAEIRSAFAGALIILAGNGDLADRVLALEIGADDFLAKTQPRREILARARSLLRRVPREEPVEAALCAHWHLDRSRRELLGPDGGKVHLTSAEFEALLCLYDRRNQPVPRSELSRVALRRSHSPTDRAVDNLMARLRRKLAADEKGGDPIRAIRGIGYLFTGFPESPRNSGATI